MKATQRFDITKAVIGELAEAQRAHDPDLQMCPCGLPISYKGIIFRHDHDWIYWSDEQAQLILYGACQVSLF